MTDTPLLSEATLFPTSTMSTVEGTEENNHKAEVPNPTVGEHHLHQHQHQHPNGAVKVVGDESAGTDVQQQVGGGGDGEGEKNALMNGNGIEGETSDVNGEEEAPTLVEAPKSANDGKLMKELDDEAPKTFPQVLMDILSNEEDSDTISWLPHGRSFIIYKKKKFAANVLPKFFKATKFTSFTRKLNRWGFTRVTRGPEMGSYYHKLFLRDDPGLCLRMSSHSSSKFQEQQQLMPSPMAPMPFGVPVAFGMPGTMPGMQPMMPGPMPGMNPADMTQQSQFINQHIQQLQWQQFQLQQLHQHQQQHHAQQQGHGPPPMHSQHPGSMGVPHQSGHPPPGHGPPHQGGPPHATHMAPPQGGGAPPPYGGGPMQPPPVGNQPPPPQQQQQQQHQQPPPPPQGPNSGPPKREGV